MGALDGKTALIFGVANHNSIAWAIAQSLADHVPIITGDRAFSAYGTTLIW